MQCPGFGEYDGAAERAGCRRQRKRDSPAVSGAVPAGAGTVIASGRFGRGGQCGTSRGGLGRAAREVARGRPRVGVARRGRRPEDEVEPDRRSFGATAIAFEFCRDVARRGQGQLIQPVGVYFGTPGLHALTGDDDVAERIPEATSSGDACVYDCPVHPLIPNLPFGGVGNSGMESWRRRVCRVRRWRSRRRDLIQTARGVCRLGASSLRVDDRARGVR